MAKGPERPRTRCLHLARYLPRYPGQAQLDTDGTGTKKDVVGTILQAEAGRRTLASRAGGVWVVNINGVTESCETLDRRRKQTPRAMTGRRNGGCRFDMGWLE